MATEVPQYQFTPLSSIVHDALHRHRSLLVDISKWALKNGRKVDRDVILLILASKAEKEIDSDFLHWTRTSVFTDLWANAFNYCSIRGGFIPENIGEQMWIFLDYLVETNQLDERSDPLSALREPLYCYWWLDANGITRTDDGPHYEPCRCHVRYRGPSHGG